MLITQCARFVSKMEFIFKAFKTIVIIQRDRLSFKPFASKNDCRPLEKKCAFLIFIEKARNALRLHQFHIAR